MSIELKQSFEHTQQSILDDNQLRNQTETSIVNTHVYWERFGSHRMIHLQRGEIIITESTTFAAAKPYAATKKVAVLNFANPLVPGGGVINGAMAQEECLCRSSNLYPCLNQENTLHEFYHYHRSLSNYIFSDRVIYTSDVTVFKDDAVLPQLLQPSEIFHVDVLTCAAPMAMRCTDVTSERLFEILKSRIKNILEVAVECKVDVLVLGAFGCGAFCNPPKLVAKAFFDVIQNGNYTHHFEKIIFAIKSSIGVGRQCPNIAAFQEEYLKYKAYLTKQPLADQYDVPDITATPPQKEKTEQELQNEADILCKLPALFKLFHESNRSDDDLFYTIITGLTMVRLYFPLVVDTNALFANVNMKTLKTGDVVHVQDDVKMKLGTIQAEDGTNILFAYTSRSEMPAHQNVHTINMYMQDYLPMVVKSNTTIIINPDSKDHFVLPVELMKEILHVFAQAEVSAQQPLTPPLAPMPPCPHPSIKPSTVPSTDANQLVGLVIEQKYSVIKNIGKGSMSVVYLAMDTQTNEKVVLKTVQKQGVRDGHAASQVLIADIDFLKNLQHPHLPRIRDIIEKEDFFYIIMDCVEGQSFQTLLEQKGAQPQDLVIDWAKQLCDVLKYLHAQTPSMFVGDTNMQASSVIISPTGNLMLVDFCIVCSINPPRDCCVCMGELGYNAPEQYDYSYTSRDQQTDIFRFGAILYHLVTGIDPDTPPYERVPICTINAQLSKELEYIISKCVKAKAIDRYQNCEELNFDLLHYDAPDILFCKNKRRNTLRLGAFFRKKLEKMV